MNTSGHGNDTLIIFVPLAVMLFAVVYLLGGPTEALETINDVVRQIVRETAEYVRSAV
jgi:hypothetical protein